MSTRKHTLTALEKDALYAVHAAELIFSLGGYGTQRIVEKPTFVSAAAHHCTEAITNEC